MARAADLTGCAECLAVLSTTRLSDIPDDSRVAAHVGTCPNCSRLVADMQLAERHLAHSLDMSGPAMPPTQVALDAITRSELERRQSIARWLRRGLAFAAAFLFVIFMRSDRGESLVRPGDYRKQSVELDCLSPEAALRLAAPLLTSRLSAAYRSGNSSYITVEGRGAEVSAVLARIDEAQAMCAVRPVIPPDLTPVDGKQGKD